MKTKTIIGITLAILLVIFALQNAEGVDVKFLTWGSNISAALLIIVTYAIGIITGILVSLKRKKKKEPIKAEPKKVVPPKPAEQIGNSAK